MRTQETLTTKHQEELSTAKTIILVVVFFVYLLLKYTFLVTIDYSDGPLSLTLFIAILTIEAFQLYTLIKHKQEIIKRLKFKGNAALQAIIMLALFLLVYSNPVNKLIYLVMFMTIPLFIPALLLSPILGLLINLTFIR